MFLYLKCQVEAFAWEKWGSPEQLDQEFEKRTILKKEQKDKKFKQKIQQLRKKTRTENRVIRTQHVHQFVDSSLNTQICNDCGLVIEMEEF
jgi:DNA-repair protein complementing XP-A cells